MCVNVWNTLFTIGQWLTRTCVRMFVQVHVQNDNGSNYVYNV